jgi:tetratricopeptide (TPR) repeat protein
VKRSWVWDGAWVGGGLLLISLTFYSYRAGSSRQPHGARIVLAPAEADRRATTARLTLQSNPEDFSALSDLAVALYQKGPESYVEAMNALEKARSLGAVDPMLFFYAGVMYDALGLPQYAANDLKKYLRHYPQDYEALVRLGNVYFHGENYEEAEALYHDAVALWKKDPTVWFNYGVVGVKRGNLDQAEKCFGEVTRLAGSLPAGGLFELGEIERLKGNDERAADFYQQELGKNPGHIPSLEALDGSYRRLKRFKEAGDVRKQLRELRKSSATVTNGEAQE